jgi:predicted Zn-dependent protease
MPSRDPQQGDSPTSPSKDDPARQPSTVAGPRLPLEEGLGHLRGGRHERAIAALRQALRREPGRFAAVRGLATAYLLAERPASARKLLDRYTTEHPMAGEGWRLAAQLEWKLGYRTRAVEVLCAGLKRLPRSQILHRQLAVFLAAEGKLAEAAVHAREMDDPTCTDVGGMIAATVGQQVEPPRLTLPDAPPAADTDWLDQIAQDPVVLASLLGPQTAPLSAESRQALVSMEWKLSRLLEAQPNHADRQLLLARLQSRLDAIPAAMLSLQRALRANPNLIEAHRLKAQLHARIGETDAAVVLLTGLLERGLAWPDIHCEIARLEQQRGRADAARAHLYSAIRLNPHYAGAREMLERVAA